MLKVAEVSLRPRGWFRHVVGRLRSLAPTGVTTGMCKQPPDELLIQAMVEYLDESLDTEGVIREALARAGFNDPKLQVEECVQALVDAYLQRAMPS